MGPLFLTRTGMIESAEGLHGEIGARITIILQVSDGEILKLLLRHALYSPVKTVVHPLSHRAFNDHPQIPFTLY